jgi:hypothetical protein
LSNNGEDKRDKIGEAIEASKTGPQQMSQVDIKLLNGRIATLVFPVPLYANDVVRIMQGVNQVWAQMPNEGLPEGKKPTGLIVANRLPQ